MKIDPYNHKQRFLKWKAENRHGIAGLSKENSDLIKRFISDMELGLNVSLNSRKGPRSFIRLNTLRDKLPFFARTIAKEFGRDPLTKITEEEIHVLFSRMRDGTIVKKSGKAYQAASYYVSVFKAFWHWYMNVKRREGISIPDITSYLDARQEKPAWVYLTENDVRRLCNEAKFQYRVLMMFMFDSGIRSPTELVNVRLTDLSVDCRTLHIREEVSKTFGRRINLLLCPELLSEYIREMKPGPTDPLFSVRPYVVNRYLKRLARRVLGDGASLAGEIYSKLTMYDFRHSSACYWLARYKSEAALKYRFGWKKTEQIHYYTELLGMKDTITDEDLLLGADKTELEKRLEKSKREKGMMQEQIDTMQRQIIQISDSVERILDRVRLAS